MNKPYLLIAGDQYYPSAYTGDWIACFATYEEAKQEVIDVVVPKYHNKKFGSGMVSKYSIRGAEYDWYEIVNLLDWCE